MTLRKVYVVRGSEDGTLGVYSSAAKAIDRAAQYLVYNVECSELRVNRRTYYRRALANMRAGAWFASASAIEDPRLTAEVEAFYLL